MIEKGIRMRIWAIFGLKLAKLEIGFNECSYSECRYMAEFCDNGKSMEKVDIKRFEFFLYAV